MKNICLLISICCICKGCGFSLECDVKITKDFVYFDYCYNGLQINELKVEDSVVNRYPSRYEKISQFKLWRKDPSGRQNKNVKIFFKKKSESFEWMIFNCDNYEKLSCFPDKGNYVVKDTIHLFKPDTWYLFTFYNPGFDIFVHCNKEGDVSFIKHDLNPNFESGLCSHRQAKR